MLKKLGFWLIWIGFIAYVIFFAPPLQPETLTLLKKLFTGQWQLINPIILSIFSMVGICILIHSCFMFFDGRMQKIPAWVFVVASVGTGVIGLLPYFALREPNQEFSGEKDAWLKWLDSRSTGVILSLSTSAILSYGLLFGDWGDFIQQFQNSKFINAMNLAVCLLILLFPTVLGDDMARRQLKNPLVFWTVALLPLFGTLGYLCLRPPLPETFEQLASSQ